MDGNKILRVAGFYHGHLGDLGVVAREGGLPLQHCRWMCSRIYDMIGVAGFDQKALDKANRWLGFVQGVLFSEKVFTIAQMRDHNRVEEVKGAPGT